jgi:hypothetical protein
MALQTQKSIFASHAAAVVDHPDQPFASLFDFDQDLPGTGIERVFQQLLDRGRRPFNHLAGGDFVAEVFGKKSDSRLHYRECIHPAGKNKRPVGAGRSSLVNLIGFSISLFVRAD